MCCRLHICSSKWKFRVYCCTVLLLALSGDIILFKDAIVSSMLGKKFWGFPRFAGDCASGHRKSQLGTSSEQKFEITDSCSQMILQLHDVYDPNKVSI